MHVETAKASPSSQTITISCDECSMQATEVCAACVVSFVLERTEGRLQLDDDEAHVLELFGAAGMVPLLKYRSAAP